MEKVPNLQQKAFRNAEGRETSVKYEKKELLSASGEYGDIYRVEARFPNEEGNKTRAFVVKEFKSEHAQQDARAAFDTYQKVRGAGAHTWPTYRIGEDDRTILMTDGELEHAYLFGYNNASESKAELQEQQINRITNLEEALAVALEDARRCAMAHLFLPYDAWFCQLTLDEEHNASVSFFIGDFDTIEDGLRDHRKGPDAALKELMESNTGCMRNAVYWMLKDVLGPEKAATIFKTVMHFEA